MNNYNDKKELKVYMDNEKSKISDVSIFEYGEYPNIYKIKNNFYKSDDKKIKPDDIKIVLDKKISSSDEDEKSKVSDVSIFEEGQYPNIYKIKSKLVIQDQQSFDKKVIEDFATLRLVYNAENIVLQGTPEVGKSHLQLLLRIEAAKAEISVYFTTQEALFGD